MPAARSHHIDALRGFAILLVIQFHLLVTTGAYDFLGLPLVLQRILDYGWAGVDLFFVLSAYLLTRNLLAQEDAPGVVSRFYLRRALRILPMYYCLLGLGFALEALLGSDRSGWLWNGRYDATSYLLFVQNWIHGAEGHPGGQFYAPTWSLAVEEHFYLVLPLLVLTLSRRGLLAMAMAWILISPWLRLYVETAANTLAAYTWTVSRLDSFGWGIVIAGLHPLLGRWIAGRQVMLIASAAALASIVAIKMPAERPGEPEGLIAITALTFCAAVVVLACITLRPKLPARFPGHQIHGALRWAGERCFSLYLLHMPVLGLTYLALGRADPSVADRAAFLPVCLSLVLTLLLSSASFRYIEAPFMRLAERLTHQQRGPRAAAAERA